MIFNGKSRNLKQNKFYNQLLCDKNSSLPYTSMHYKVLRAYYRIWKTSDKGHYRDVAIKWHSQCGVYYQLIPKELPGTILTNK